MHRLMDRYLEFQDRLLYTHGKEAIAIFVFISAIGFVFFWYLSTRLWSAAPEPASKIQVVVEHPSSDQRDEGQRGEAVILEELFICTDGRSIRAQFGGAQVNLQLSDGRNVTIPQVSSGALNRYSNSDGSFVFLTNRKTAFISENGIATYANCAAK